MATTHNSGLNDLGRYNTSNPVGQQIGSQGWSRQSRPGSVSDVIEKLKSLSINIDKIFKLESEDKLQVWKMVDEIIGIISKGESEGYSHCQLLKLKLIYNTLYNSDYLCTKRDKNLANLLDDEK